MIKCTNGLKRFVAKKTKEMKKWILSSVMLMALTTMAQTEKKSWLVGGVAKSVEMLVVTCVVRQLCIFISYDINGKYNYSLHET